MNQALWNVLLRHSLFLYARNMFRFFLSVYLWRETGDIRIVCMFNMLFWGFHLVAFFYGCQLIKLGYPNQLIKTGILGIAVLTFAVALLQEQTVEYVYLIGVLLGLFNGQYWVVNHLDMFDKSTKQNRTTFFSYRQSFVNTTKVAMPVVAWLAFVLFSTTQAAYNFLFLLAAASSIAALFFTSVKRQKETPCDLRGTFRILRSTPRFWDVALVSMINAALIKGAIFGLLMPILIFELLEGEIGLSSVETWTQVGTVVAAYVFARYKKNTELMRMVIYVGSLVLFVGLMALYVKFSPLTYAIYIIAFVVSSSSLAFAWNTTSANFTHTIKDYKKYRIEYIAIKEVFVIIGVLSGYAFLYMFNSIGVEALRPLLAFMMTGAVVALPFYIRVWNQTQKLSDRETGNASDPTQ